MKHRKPTDLTDIKKISSPHLLLVDGSGSDAHGQSCCSPDGLLIYHCLSGSLTFNLDGVAVTCGTNNFFAITPGQVFTQKGLTPDVRYVELLIPGDHLSRLRQVIDMSYVYGMLSNEVFRAPKSAVEEAMPIYDLIRSHGEREGNEWHFRDPHREAIAMALVDVLGVIINSIADSATRTGREHGALSRQEVIARRFFSNLLKRHKENHTVEYYAQLEGLTPKYLSTAIRQATSRTAQEWIAMVVVFSVKRMLLSTSLSVAEVAAAYNFTSASAFIRFFKTNTGVTPMAFRK